MSPPLTTVTYQVDPAEMARRGRIGAYILHSRRDPKETTKKARASFLERFEREVDPDGELSEAERTRRAAYARKAYFARLANASANARREKKNDNRAA